MSKTSFELQLLKALNGRIAADGVDALALRWPLSKFAHQPIDIIVDSEDMNHYLAIECKSIKRANKAGLYLSSHFSQKVRGDQFKAETEYIQRSGRRGFCAVELWSSAGNTCHIIPWDGLIQVFGEGRPGLSLIDIMDFPGPRRVPGPKGSKGGYIIESWSEIFGEC